MENLANYELKYYEKICNIQSQYIKGDISKEELESRCEIERKKYISHLNERNLQLQRDIESQMRVTAMIESIWKK